MKRIQSWLFGGAAVVSLLICVISAAVWVRSEFVAEEFSRVEFGPSALADNAICWVRGRIILTRSGGLEKGPSPAVARWTYERFSAQEVRGFDIAKWLRVERGFCTPSPGASLHYIDRLEFHACLFFFPSLILPAIWATRFAGRRHRTAAGHCQDCGYDLRATPDRCPECGSASANEAPDVHPGLPRG